jgi:hypothetical protein
MPQKDSAISTTTKVQMDSLAPPLFSESLLKPVHEKPLLHFTRYDYTVAGVLFFAFVLFVWLYTVNRKRLNQVIRAFYISRYANQLSREEISIGNRVSIFLSLLFVITITLFVVQLNRYYHFSPVEESPLLFLIIGLTVAGIYFCKILVVKFFGFIFQTGKEAGEYTMSLFLFGNVLGLFMMPVVICLSFARQIPAQVFIYGGLAVIGTFLCARLVRGVIIGLNSSRVSTFYLFLYLCTLEILPFVVLVKLFILHSR